MKRRYRRYTAENWPKVFHCMARELPTNWGGIAYDNYCLEVGIAHIQPTLAAGKWSLRETIESKHRDALCGKTQYSCADYWKMRLRWLVWPRHLKWIVRG